jgi:eukaryotic-like serine/threonine-protein kinase
MRLSLPRDTAPVPSPSHDPLPGVTLDVPGVGAVLFGSAIAQGGIGVVHAASRAGSRAGDARPVAVKVLQQRHAGDAGIVRRFEREAAHALRLRHPNVVSALGAGRLADGRPFFVMDLLEGATLGALVRAGGPLPIGQGLRLAEQILAGLEALHGAHLVHRDLSPDNVFVTRSSRAVILDLGFAQAPGVDTGDGLTHDSPGSLVGTLAFMAPEQATRSRAITERSDLFAAAVLFYYAFSGKLPFRGHDDLDVLVSVLRAAPVPLRRARRDAPAALEAVLAHALAKHPDARFAGAREMRDAIGQIDLAPRRARCPATRSLAGPTLRSTMGPPPLPPPAALSA